MYWREKQRGIDNADIKKETHKNNTCRTAKMVEKC